MYLYSLVSVSVARSIRFLVCIVMPLGLKLSPRIVPFDAYSILLLSMNMSVLFLRYIGKMVNFFVLVLIFHFFSKLLMARMALLVFGASMVYLPWTEMICVMSSAYLMYLECGAGGGMSCM